MVNKILTNDIFIKLAEPIIMHEMFGKLKEIPHHDGSVYEHSMLVAYFSFRVAKLLKLDLESTVRGALLHDFYLYKYQKPKDKNMLVAAFNHSRNHPKIAFKNAEKHFELNKKEANIIKSHMFPVGFPRSVEAWIITLVDKAVATLEYSKRFKGYVLQG